MHTIIIPQKMSGTGTIHDLASDMYDRRILYGSQYHYAVVSPAYYNLTCTRHATLGAAVKAYRKLELDGYGPRIINRAGVVLELDDYYHPIATGAEYIAEA